MTNQLLFTTGHTGRTSFQGRSRQETRFFRFQVTDFIVVVGEAREVGGIEAVVVVVWICHEGVTDRWPWMSMLDAE